MLQVLRISFVQALRSIILILLPIAFIFLITWATAGSASGNTADPIRAALWFFLAAHQIPLQLSITDSSASGALSFLPLGALAIPYLAIRTGFKRAIVIAEAELPSDERRYQFAFAFSYSIIAFMVTQPALGNTVSVPFYICLPVLFVIAIAFTAKFKKIQPFLRSALLTITFLIGVGSLFLAMSFIIHFEQVTNLTRVVEPGFFGGLALTIIQLLYIPNLAISALSYLVGAGFSISADTLISPLIHRIDEIPAIPILGALPTGSQPLFLLFVLIVILSGVAAARFLTTVRSIAAAILTLCLLTFLSAFAAGGELISANLKSVGPIWWTMPLLLSAEFAVGVIGAHLAARLREQLESSNDQNP